MSLLDLIAQCTPGTTINLQTRQLVRKSFWTGLYRWWYEEDRGKLISAIEAEINTQFVTFGEKELLSLIVGLQNLAQTYQDDMYIVRRLSILIEKLERRHIYTHVYTRVGYPWKCYRRGLHCSLACL